MNDLRKSEIKSLLDENNIEYKSSSKKSDLIELLKKIYIEEEVFLSDVEEVEEEPILEVKEEVKEKKAVKKWIDRYYYVNGVKHTYPRDKNSYYYVLE